MLAVIILSACQSRTSDYSHDETETLIERIKIGENLDNQDYEMILSQLDGMLYVVGDKAQLLVDSGYKRTDVRMLLKRDSEYMVIYTQSGILDSVMTQHLQSPSTNTKLRKQYDDLLHKHAKRLQNLGLN